MLESTRMADQQDTTESQYSTMFDAEPGIMDRTFIVADNSTDITTMTSQQKNEQQASTPKGFMKKCCNAPSSFQKRFRKEFSKLGGLIHRNRAFFIVVPLLVTGHFWQYFLQDLDKNIDFKDLILGKESEEKAIIREYFDPPDGSDENSTLSCRNEKPKNRRSLIVFAILRNKSDNALLETNFLDLVKLEKRLKHTFKTADECVGSCKGNQLIDLLEEEIKDAAKSNETVVPPWPGYLNEETMEVIAFPGLVARPELSEDGTQVVSIAGLNFKYHLVFEDQTVGDDWETSFMRNLTVIRQDFPRFEITANGELGWKNDKKQKLESMKSRLVWSALAVIVVAVATAWDSRWERNKTGPLLLALFFSAMAITTTKGIMTYAGVPWTSFNYAVFFIMLGVGLDDTFVFLASWTNSDPRKTTEARMSLVFSEAAVAVTLTSLTDAMSFWIGAFAPFELSIIFCKYAGTGMLVLYVYQICLFGATLSIFGSFEESKRNGLLFRRIRSSRLLTAKNLLLPSSVQKEGKAGSDVLDDETEVNFSQPSFLGKLRMIRQEENSIQTNNGVPEYISTKLLRDYWGKWMNMLPVQIVVAVIYTIYISGAIYYLHHLQVGIKPVELCFTGSELQRHLQAGEENFAYLGARFQVAVIGQIDYSDPAVQQDMEDLAELLESHPWIAEGDFTDSWLRNFQRYQQLHTIHEDDVQDDEQTFIEELQDFMDTRLGSSSSKNVVLSEDGKHIIASRFFFQVMDVPKDQNANKVLPAIRSIIAEFPEYEIYAYDELFPWYEHDLSLPRHTLEALGLACITVLVLAMIFIPKISVACFVVFTLASIQLGVAGYSVPMGGKLEVGMTIGLIMSIGFCVDFATHISFAYVTSSPPPSSSAKPRHSTHTAAWKIRDALGKLGWPIIQSAVTSIVAVLPLCSTPAYLFRMLAWNMSCIMVFGLFHGLAVLPVLFSLTSKVGAKCRMIIQKNGNVERQKAGCSTIEDDLRDDVSPIKLGTSYTTETFVPSSPIPMEQSDSGWSSDLTPPAGVQTILWSLDANPPKSYKKSSSSTTVSAPESIRSSVGHVTVDVENHPGTAEDLD